MTTIASIIVTLSVLTPKTAFASTTDPISLPAAIEATKATTTLPTTIVDPIKAFKNPDGTCSCVKFARSLIPSLPRGDAKDLVPNSFEPRVGEVVKIKYGNDYHVAVVVGLVGDIMSMHDFNFKPCKETLRDMSIYDPRIIGYRTDSK